MAQPYRPETEPALTLDAGEGKYTARRPSLHVRRLVFGFEPTGSAGRGAPGHPGVSWSRQGTSGRTTDAGDTATGEAADGIEG